MGCGDGNTGSAEVFDTIFIGSGIGTILCASLLAQFRDERVLILEKHFTPGGFTHTFKRKNRFFWDVGIHYIGDLQAGSILSKLFELLSGGKLCWQKMPSVFEKFVYPALEDGHTDHFTFSVHDDPDRFVADLVALFPAEESAIRKYIADIRKVNTWFGRHISLRGRAPFVDHLESAFTEKEGFNPRLSVQAYLNQRISDKRLKGLLLSQWGNYGLPPGKASFIVHAAVVQHYFHGGYYPLGGSHRIFESIVPFLEKTGSSVKTSHEVTEILIENRRAVGVKATALRGSEKAEQIFYGKKIISDAGAYNTYLRLLKGNPVPFAEKLEAFYRQHPVVSNVTLYLGLNDDPRRLGFGGENHWIYSSYDHDQNFREGETWVTTGKVPGCYLSFPSLKNAEAKDHTAEIIAFTDYAFFERWKEQPWRKRDEEYRRLKDFIADALLKFVEAHYPGFCSLVEYAELSTPITTEYFASHPRGSIYGVACVPERFVAAEAPWCNPVTPFENLYLTGADVSSPGIAGAMMGAVSTLSHLPEGFKLLNLMRL
jgi:phytoene dehydrogenase-like protein